MSIARLDEKTRTIWFGANGRETGQDPYFRHFYRISLDGTRAVVAHAGRRHSHGAAVAVGRYVIDTYSKPDVPPVVALRDARRARCVMPLEKADISKLLATGWKPPMPIKMTAHDGKTDIYGLMFVPTNFDPSKKYPIVNNVYPGPADRQHRQPRVHRGARRSSGARRARLRRRDDRRHGHAGTIEGVSGLVLRRDGTRQHDSRSDRRHAGAREASIPYIDLDRAGIWGHSGGGFATTTAMFRFPDFFKAGIAESGNHDQRENEDDWGERYQGLVVRNADGTDSYDAEANQNFAKNLKGHLLLAHGTMDTNVPPYQTMLIADALIKANKDFDLLMIPNSNHGYGAASNYMMRRRWDYFVKWLIGVEPPKECRIGG